ncbi:MAG TPA: O-acetyl-ADP-ribose deacetylase [Spirochaetota bacterium]|jgi:O-acetyl-ADP-ribose deacetylase (regulator of RNase III)|nr:O-acetyl-ADP-ribose deacetylase [Spirochaetota bacterium]HOH36009.1 O-acetyl-ADP-ribose deacetylase [Spirochaetota bacterium]HPJ13522.1 O-acetyl-ADP-ribose deacetylase [Spirochaetota bacterium]HPM33549.1 O-acetyl-ADP-ribose deacetylase [Spirochaetota bacterium]HPY01824.1 O-acetyl-ADP-ribose deacetylase [Spirochaetota bacterium]
MKSLLNNVIIAKGDITSFDVEAIVNAANTSLLGGGGVDGAIHKAAGPELLEECISLKGCESGKAKITKAYRLKAKYIIHTPGPVYKNGRCGERALLESSYNNCMSLAKEYNVSSIAFPAISTGIYSYPKEEACKIALKTVLAFVDKEKYFPTIYFVLYDDANFLIYKNEFEKVKNELQTVSEQLL